VQCQGTCNLWRKDGFKGIWGDLLDELVTDDASGVSIIDNILSLERLGATIHPVAIDISHPSAVTNLRFTADGWEMSMATGWIVAPRRSRDRILSMMDRVPGSCRGDQPSFGPHHTQPPTRRRRSSRRWHPP
jgi:hypothetical protein